MYATRDTGRVLRFLALSSQTTDSASAPALTQVSGVSGGYTPGTLQCQLTTAMPLARWPRSGQGAASELTHWHRVTHRLVHYHYEMYCIGHLFDSYCIL
jgi:hypothetical protein